MGEDGRPLPHDGQQFGDLLVRGPHTLSRYFRSDAKAADAEGWFDTGDVASIDAEGYMKVRGGSRWRGMQPRAQSCVGAHRAARAHLTTP